jgi:N-acetylmuramoyl-L-alanine amidase
MIRLQFLELKQISNLMSFQPSKLFFFCFLILFTINYNSHAQNSKIIKVVIDAGHGGKDSGAVGYGIYEKDVALEVTLLIAEMLETQKDIEAIYTRKKDVFIGLRERANIANDAKADLFISIHCNSVANSSPYGAETFVLGLHRNEDNLKIAMRENQVIELEENYEEKYDGFDPTSPESYIGFSLLQEQYLDQSILLADKIQKNFVGKLKRKDRGVKQAGFLVLRETYMPSVLVELGFLSNKNENTFLKSSNNQKKLAQQIFNAILEYKESLERNQSSLAVVEETIEKNKTLDDSYKATFYVQFAAGRKKLKLDPRNFKGLDNVSRVKESGLFKYRYGKSNSHKM